MMVGASESSQVFLMEIGPGKVAGTIDEIAVRPSNAFLTALPRR